ncbi:cysteine-rich venom protein-like [Cheilinus undulatus]|uniref:cysteine-rich venom protein-like n=1 Tax=Cheilinus undulatus TaxID=241271 RepID=UPI001BD5AE2B|nr:cysteine-rich venom protein-like [Cheilinus undulatus]
MAPYSLIFVCVFSLFAAVQVPGTSALMFVSATQCLCGSEIKWDLGLRLKRNDGGSGVSSSEITEIVNKHNELRRSAEPTASNMLKMSWNSEAAVNAHKWASTCSMRHSTKGSRKISSMGCGENLYMSKQRDTWSDAIQSWYDEVKDWHYGEGSFTGRDVGHFTQVDWYRSNHIGCGMAYCPDSDYTYFYVCHYCPPGNYQLYEPYKKGPTCGDCPDACEDKLCTNPCGYFDMYGNCADLKKKYGCHHKSVAAWCPASCKCTTEII